MSEQLQVDWTRCEGVGYCAEILPELIQLDDWGYPIVDPKPITDRGHLEHARRAVATCPRLALLLDTHGDRR